MSTRWRVGVDLAPASRMNDAPGTAVHVREQLTALFQLDVPWDWAPVAESENNPLLPLAKRWSPSLLPGRSVWRRSTFGLNAEWTRRGCQLGFATAYFVPASGLPVVTNFFDAGAFTAEYAQSWITSGRRWNFYLTKTLQTYALLRSQKLFVDSHYWCDLLVRKFPHVESKIVVTPCGARAPRTTPVETIPSWATGLTTPFALYAGAFSDNKNQPRLLELWSKLQAVHADLPPLVLIGPCEEDYHREKIDPWLRKMPRPNDVRLPGKVSDEDLAWAFQHALFYLQPSFMEGFGMPIVEAMSYGLPVACSNTTSLPETAGGASLLFSPSELPSMEAAVLTLWKDTATRDKLIAAGRERCQLFTWRKNAEIVATQIENLLLIL